MCIIGLIGVESDSLNPWDILPSISRTSFLKYFDRSCQVIPDYIKDSIDGSFNRVYRGME